MRIAIPYASLPTFLPALVLVAANVTNFLGPTIQLGAVVALLVALSGCLQFEKSLSWTFVLYFAVCLAIGFLAYGPDQAVVRAGKLMLFVFASLLTVKGASAGNRFPALLALRSFLVVAAANVAYAIGMGHSVFRADYLIEFSIYSSYTIAILVFLARPLLTVGDRVAAYFFLVLCGSTMGLLLLILAEVLGRKLRTRALIAL